MVTISKDRYAFGLCPIGTLKGFPEGDIKIIQRAGAFVKVVVRDHNTTRQFRAKIVGSHWICSHEIGRNSKHYNVQPDGLTSVLVGYAFGLVTASLLIGLFIL